MSEIKVKYIKGIPTKKCIRELIKEFFGEIHSYKIRPSSYSWEGESVYLTWSRDEINERIDEFAGYLTEHGIEVGTLRLYKSPMTGGLQIKNKQNEVSVI